MLMFVKMETISLFKYWLLCLLIFHKWPAMPHKLSWIIYTCVCYFYTKKEFFICSKSGSLFRFDKNRWERREKRQPVIPMDTVRDEHLTLGSFKTLGVWLEGGWENRILTLDLFQRWSISCLYHTYSVSENFQVYHFEIFMSPDFLL